jgi:hypothetical protein
MDFYIKEKPSSEDHLTFQLKGKRRMALCKKYKYSFKVKKRKIKFIICKNTKNNFLVCQ